MVLKKIETQHDAKYDRLKWLVAALLLIAGLVANYHYNSHPWPLRLLGWLFLLAVIVAVVLQTCQGKQALDFMRESRVELRKVIWPTRQETVQMTFLVAAMVIMLALVLWGIDGVLMWVIGWLTGQRG